MSEDEKDKPTAGVSKRTITFDIDKIEEYAAEARKRFPRLVEQEENIQALFASLKEHLPELEKLLKEISVHWTYEDGIYRYYHHSFKVFYNVQPMTLEIVEALKALAPGRDLNPMFLRIVEEGTGKEFSKDFNEIERWQKEGRPVVEAFFHAKFFLEMAVKYGKELEYPPRSMPSGWAAFLYLYNLR